MRARSSSVVVITTISLPASDPRAWIELSGRSRDSRQSWHFSPLPSPRRESFIANQEDVIRELRLSGTATISESQSKVVGKIREMVQSIVAEALHLISSISAVQLFKPRMSKPRTISLALLVSVASAQPNVPTSFDVAAIKPTPDSDVGAEWSPAGGGRFVAKGVTLKELISVAWGIQSFQVTGGGRWVGTERWSIEAKAESFAGRLSREQLQKPLQDLLAARFKLRTRQVMRKMPVYSLVKIPGSPKLKPAKEPSRTISFGRGSLHGTSASIDLLARVLATLLERPVLNQTGITGEYDISMEWSPEPGTGDFLPGTVADLPDRKLGSIFTEIQEQLGLRLESKRAPAEVVVVESAARPTAD